MMPAWVGGRALRLLRGAAFALLALPTACLPESNAPVAPVTEAVEEPGLFGSWGAAFGSGALHVHVLRGEGVALRVLLVSHEPDGGGEIDTYRAHVSAVGGRRFANLQEVVPPVPDAVSAEAAPWLLFGIELTAPDALTVRFLAEETLARAIEGGALKGEIDDAGEGVSIRITDDSPRIAAFLANADPAGLFDRSLTFHRLSPPRP